MQTDKWCNDCKKLMPLESFYKDKNSPDGKDYFCKSCRKRRKLSRKAKEDAYQREYRKNARDRRLKYSRDFNKNNKDYFRNWRAVNTSKTRAYAQSYKFRKKSGTPDWLTEEQLSQIESVYSHARDCEIVSGEKYHVDHIIPIKGENICGLHVPWNLQVLPADVNIRKSNRVIND